MTSIVREIPQRPYSPNRRSSNRSKVVDAGQSRGELVLDDVVGRDVGIAKLEVEAPARVEEIGPADDGADAKGHDVSFPFLLLALPFEDSDVPSEKEPDEAFPGSSAEESFQDEVERRVETFARKIKWLRNAEREMLRNQLPFIRDHEPTEMLDGPERLPGCGGVAIAKDMKGVGSSERETIEALFSLALFGGFMSFF